MFRESGSTQSESYLFCAEKNFWRVRTFRVCSYLRCSFLFLFQALCIKQRLFYGPSFNVSVAMEVQYLTPVPPAGNRSARQSQPGEGPLRPVPPSLSVPPRPILPTASGTSHLEKHLEESRARLQ